MAPTLLEIIDAYIALKEKLLSLIISTYSPEVGILLARLEIIKEESPYDQIGSIASKKVAILVVIPLLLNDNTITNIESTKGITTYGRRLIELPNKMNFCLLNKRYIKENTNKLVAEQTQISHSGQTNKLAKAIKIMQINKQDKLTIISGLSFIFTSSTTIPSLIFSFSFL